MRPSRRLHGAQFYNRPARGVKQKLPPVPQGLESLQSGLTKGGFGGELAGLPERQLRLVVPVFRHKNEPEIVIGALEARLEADGEAERLLRLRVAVDVVVR